MRRAVSRAVDRTPLVQTTYASHAVASPLPVHPDSPLYDQGAAGRLSYAPEELAGHLAELGLEGAALTLLVNSENEAKASAADLIAYQLESAGLASRWSGSPSRTSPPPWPPGPSTCTWGRRCSPPTSTWPPCCPPRAA